MSTWGTIAGIVGLIVFLIGYYFLSYSLGQRYQDNNPRSDTNMHFTGGMIGVVSGVVVALIGMYLTFSHHGAMVDQATFGAAAAQYSPTPSYTA